MENLNWIFEGIGTELLSLVVGNRTFDFKNPR